MELSLQLLNNKEKKLIKIIKNYNPLMIAFSGGLDSTYLLYIAVKALGPKNILAATAKAPIYTTLETQNIDVIINQLNVSHYSFDHQIMSEKKFTNNPTDRCYHCKNLIFSSLRNIAGKHSIKHIAHGENCDDLISYRPGSKAAKEHNILSPLVEAGLTRNDIQILAKYHGLCNWDLPQMACLATRLPYYQEITLNLIEMIDQAEKILFQMGFPGARVRWIEKTAKIEIPKKQLASFFHRQLQGDILNRFIKIGFKDIFVDPEGYRSGFDDALAIDHSQKTIVKSVNR